MNQNCLTGIYTNSLSSHASLLLSATPTIVSSPLQTSSSCINKNTNNNSISKIGTATSLSSDPPNSPPSSPPSIQAGLVPIYHRKGSASTMAPAALNLDDPSKSEASLGYIIAAPMPNYINFKKPQNEIFKKLDGKIQKIVAAHSNLNKLYALNDFPSLGAGPKRPFELPPQLPPPPPWVPKCSTSDEVSKLGLDGSKMDEDDDDANSGSSSFSKEHLGQLRNRSMITYKNQLVKKFLSGPDKAKQSGAKASLILDAAISKLHQRHQQQKMKEQEKKLGPCSSIPTVTPVSLAQLRSINNSDPDPVPSSSSNIASNLESSLSTADFNMLEDKIKQTIDTQTFNNSKKRAQTPEEGRKYQEAIMSQFKEQLYSLTRSIRLKIPPPPATSDPKEQKSILMKKSPQSLFKTIQRETSLLLNRRHSQNARSSLSLLSDQQNYKRQNSHVKQAILTNTPVYRPYSMRVIVPPTKAHYSLKLNNYLEDEIPQPTADVMTIEEFAKGLNLVRSNDASLQRHQEQLLQSNSNWRNTLSTRPLRLRRIRGENIRMPVSASYKAARKIGLQ